MFDHVAKAVLKALRVVTSRHAHAGIALPDNESHRREINQVKAALHDARVAVFWVNDTRDVTAEVPWVL